MADGSPALERLKLDEDGIDIKSPSREPTTLPLELLPVILSHLSHRVKDLAPLCLVSRTFAYYATPLLYEKLWLRDQRRLFRVFRTLASNISLCRHVRVLEMRVYPFGLGAEELERLEGWVEALLRNADGLRELYWTRTGSLNDRLIPHLRGLSSLRVLEVTGDSRGWSPSLLVQSLPPGIEHISLLLPDRNVCSRLVDTVKALPGLKSFSVLCQHSTVIRDGLLLDMAPHMTNLTRLSLAGCRSLTHAGIEPVLRSTKGGLLELSLEALALDSAALGTFAPLVPNLQALVLTLPRANHPSAAAFPLSLQRLLGSLSHLSSFTLYASSWNRTAADADAVISDAEGSATGEDSEDGSDAETQGHPPSGGAAMRGYKLQDAILQGLLTGGERQERGERLSKIRIHGIGVSLAQVGEICMRAPRLRELVVHLYEAKAKEALPALLSGLGSLRSLHVLSSAFSPLVLSERDLESIADSCADSLRVIGFRNRVWEVERVLLNDADRYAAEDAQPNVSSRGDATAKMQGPRHRTTLRRWDWQATGSFPEALLVVRA